MSLREIDGLGTTIHHLERLMGLALTQASLAQNRGEVPVGAVLVDAGGAVVGEGFNQPISSHDPTAHAEIVALRAAASNVSNYRLPGTTMVVTVEPCLMCAGALVNARVSRVVYGAAEPKWGALGSRLSLGNLGLNHQIEVVSGVREAECAALLRAFFRARRLGL
jgi:tRNA(adenine34) deaminase